MSEMLGNQYFMARNYPAAQNELEEVYLNDSSNKSVIKKLIICYTQTGKVKNAINLFNKLIAEDIDFIIDTHPIIDDCPCFELTDKIESRQFLNSKSLDYYLILGIVWLYCDINKSYEYFKYTKKLEPNNKQINMALEIIEKRIYSKNSN